MDVHCKYQPQGTFKKAAFGPLPSGVLTSSWEGLNWELEYIAPDPIIYCSSAEFSSLLTLSFVPDFPRRSLGCQAQILISFALKTLGGAFARTSLSVGLVTELLGAGLK